VEPVEGSVEIILVEPTEAEHLGNGLVPRPSNGGQAGPLVSHPGKHHVQREPPLPGRAERGDDPEGTRESIERAELSVAWTDAHIVGGHGSRALAVGVDEIHELGRELGEIGKDAMDDTGLGRRRVLARPTTGPFLRRHAHAVDEEDGGRVGVASQSVVALDEHGATVPRMASERKKKATNE
jgi:hypothetical protein